MRLSAKLNLSTAMVLAIASTAMTAAPTAANAQSTATPSTSTEQQSNGAEPAAGGAAVTAPATENPSAGTPGAGSGVPGGLEDIVVTAQRRSENLQRAAIPVTAVTSATLVREGVTDSTRLTEVVPALQVSTITGSQTAFYLRGVGNFTSNSLTDAAVSVNLDGVVISRSGAVQGMFFDLERVEVLKGPQGTLYGRNATGGAINFITAKPRIGETSGYATFQYGNFNDKQLNAALNIATGEHSALRVAGYLSDHDGYYSDRTGDDRTRSVRAQFTSDVSNNLKVTVGGDYSHVGGKGAGGSVYGLDKNDRIGVSDPRAGAIFSASFSPLAGDFLKPITAIGHSDNTYYGFYAQADLKTSIGTLTVLPAYRKAQLDFLTYGGGFGYPDRLNDNQYSVEARLASDSANRLSYLFGLYYLRETADEAASVNQQFFDPYYTADSVTNSYAAFTRLTFKVTDRFRLIGGARYTVDQKKAVENNYDAIVICGSPTGLCPGTPSLPTQLAPPAAFVLPSGAGNPFYPWGPSGAFVNTAHVFLTPSKTFRRPTYRVGVEYDLGPQSLFYATYETGFKSGGFYSSIDNAIYKPETIDAATVGVKNRFLDNRLQLNFEGFWWSYKNQQVSHYAVDSSGSPEFRTENIGKSRLRGFEIEGRARLFEGTTLNSTVQFLDATDQNFTYTSPALVGPPVTGCATSLSGATYTINCSGRRPSNAPKWVYSGGVEQDINVGTGRVVLNANAKYQSAVYTGFELLATERQKGYIMLDLQAQYELPGGHFSIAGYANNLTDKNVVAFSVPHPRSAQLLLQNYRAPRLYGVRVGYKF